MHHYEHARHFTLNEAASLLKEIKPSLLRMVELHASLVLLNYDIYKHRYLGGKGPNGDRYHPIALEELVKILRTIEESGIVVKSIPDGLIDFPALRGDEEIYLCWKAGEDGIGFWHGLTEGFQGRKPISEL